MSEKKLGGAGLRGQVAGETALCTVGKSGTGLTYCGYDISDLADNSQFEEVAYMLTRGGELPTVAELTAFKTKLHGLRGLPSTLKEVLERIPADAHPMDVLRTGCSMLGNLETEQDFASVDDHIDRMLACFPSIICYWYRYSHDGVKIDVETDADSIGGHFLQLLTDKKASELHENVINVSLILYAEHEFNASTFAARVCASTLSDIHSCITAAIGTLRGPLHGGANEAAMELIEKFPTVADAEAGLLQMLARKEKIMGFGHAVYRESDPRNAIIKRWSKRLAEDIGQPRLYEVSERCEQVMWEQKRLFCNADFFHASAYNYMKIPTKLFTPIFVMSRISGWAGHIKEQRSNNRIIRPSAAYTGVAPRKVMAIDQR